MQVADPLGLLLMRVRRVWAQLANVTDAFEWASTAAVVVSPTSRLCPPSWVGIVTVGDAALVTAPTDRHADRMRTALAALPISELTDVSRLGAILPITDVRGPATLAYLIAEEFRASDTSTVVREPSDHRDIARLVASIGAADAAESGLARITSPAFVVRADGDVVAAAGYQVWLDSTAHLAVLTAEHARGHGLARIVASAAIHHALDRRLLPQWRARPAASRRVAQALGFREVGSQLSITIG
jgi:GNAT superfamily N-acetyltransferase